MISMWQERDGDGTEEGENLLTNQLMVGSQPGPIKCKLNKQIHDLH